jgi:hypothetical protein
MKKTNNELSAELLIMPDGRILVQNLTQPMAEILRQLNPRDRQIAPRARQKCSAHDRKVVQVTADGFPPHPDPLPPGEGTAVGHFDKICKPSSSLQPLHRQDAENDSPSPRGEGGGEGKRSGQFTGAATRK